MDRITEVTAFRLLAGCAAAVYVSGTHLTYPEAPVHQFLSIATAASTGSISAVTFNLTTFANIDPPPPVVPPGDKQQQG